MSKAFTKESDEEDASDLPVAPLQSASLPRGTKNYMTPDGARRLGEEMERLSQMERPRFAALPDAPDAKRRLQALDQRLRALEESLASAEIVPVPTEAGDRVWFGATVTVRESGSGEEEMYRIVGVDETDFDRGWVSWLSPIARALLNGRLGERVRFRFPSGERELEITAIRGE